MRIDVLVVIAERKSAELFRKAATAGIVHAALAPTVATPIADRQRYLAEKRVVGIDRSTLTCGQMVRRIKTRSSDIPPGAGVSAGELRAEGVAIVFDQPETVFIAKRLDRPYVEGIAESMRKHDGLRLR